jgi:hypothetical protein
MLEVWLNASKTWFHETLAMQKRISGASNLMALLVLLSSVFVGAYWAALALISTDLIDALIGAQRTGALHSDLTEAVWKLIIITAVFFASLLFSRTLQRMSRDLFDRLKSFVFILSSVIIASFATWPVLLLLLLVLWIGVTIQKAKIRLVIGFIILATILLLIYGLAVEVTYHSLTVGEFVGWSGALIAFGLASMESLHR